MSRFIGLKLEPDTDVYSCPHCGKEYKSETALEKHVAKEHTDNSVDDD